jgi:hypothetical protein
MMQVCPRCSSRLGPPLKSGRQVCANCGWSSEPTPKQRSSHSQEPHKTTSPWQDVIMICWRIIQRSFLYVWQRIQLLLQQSRVSENSVRPDQWATGLKKRLSALEEAIPTSVEHVNEIQSWMTLEEAFKYLGGDISDPRSRVATLEGTANFSFQQFSRLKSAGDFKTFGLEADLMRRDEEKPWLRSLL